MHASDPIKITAKTLARRGSSTYAASLCQSAGCCSLPWDLIVQISDERCLVDGASKTDRGSIGKARSAEPLTCWT